DGDGNVDLAFSYANQPFIRVYWGHGNGTFSSTDFSQFSIPFANSFRLMAGRFTGGTYLDLAVVASDGAVVQLPNQKAQGKSWDQLFATARMWLGSLGKGASVSDVVSGNFDNNAFQDLILGYSVGTGTVSWGLKVLSAAGAQSVPTFLKPIGLAVGEIAN